MKRTCLLLLLCLVSFLILSCTEEAPTALTQTAAWQGENASIVLSLPEDWAWNLFPENEDDAHLGSGIRFYPADDPTAGTVVRFDNGFGVCGTGLETKKITLAGGTQITSYAWDGSKPTLYRFENTPGTRNSADAILTLSCRFLIPQSSAATSSARKPQYREPDIRHPTTIAFTPISMPDAVCGS